MLVRRVPSDACALPGELDFSSSSTFLHFGFILSGRRKTVFVVVSTLCEVCYPFKRAYSKCIYIGGETGDCSGDSTLYCTA